MTIADRIAAITTWQASPIVHPLTCGNDSTHKPLVPTEEDGEIILICPDCDYVQGWVPDICQQKDTKDLLQKSMERLQRHFGLIL